MRVLIVTAVFPPEPVVSSQLSFDIANDLSNKGNVVTVICPKPTRPYGYDHHQDKVYYSFRKIILKSYTNPESKILGRFKESYSFGKHCYRFVDENFENIDVIYSNTWPLFAQYFLVKAAMKHKLPIIMHIQDIYPESLAEKQRSIVKKLLQFLLIPFDKKTLSNCTKIVTISLPMKDYLVQTRQIDHTKVSVVRNWQNDNMFLNVKRIEKPENAEFIFMYLGSLTPSAGIDTLIHAFGKAHLQNCKLILAGEGSRKSEYVKIAEHYPDENIEFITAPSEMVHIIQLRADVLLLPLKKGMARTASPSKLTAYMFSGKPIIASVDKDSDTANCINEAKCGLIVDPSDKNELAKAMIRFINLDRAKLDEYGLNSLNYAIAHLSKETNMNKLISIITGL